jgi:hypothetical protein
MTQDRIRLLAKIQFDWDANAEKWNATYNELVIYHFENGNCMVPTNGGNGGSNKLRMWVRDQLQFFL